MASGNRTGGKRKSASLQPGPAEERDKATAQLRFEVGDAVEIFIDDCWSPGTVVKLRHESSPYAIRLADGAIVYNRANNGDCIRRRLSEDGGAVGLRFKVGDRVECRETEDGEWIPGTVAGLWESAVDYGGADDLCPYRIRCDDGMVAFLGSDSEILVRKTNVPPVAVLFDAGERVEFKLPHEKEWRKGIVLRRRAEGDSCDVPPYVISLDGNFGDMDDRMVKFWSGHIRATKLRFKVGDRVEFNTSETGWAPGTITKSLYYHTNHRVAVPVPYLVQLNDGRSFLCYCDEDCFVRKAANAPPPSCYMCFENEQSEDNIIERTCNCIGEGNGFVHVKCLVRAAKSRSESGGYKNGIDPYETCSVCNGSFRAYSLSYLALAKERYQIHHDDPLGSFARKNCVIGMAVALIQGSWDHDAAVSMLQEHISLAKIEIGNEARSSEKQEVLNTLVSWLVHLGRVHKFTENLDEMKALLDEAQALVAEGRYPDVIHIDIMIQLGRHAYLTYEYEASLGYFQKGLVIHRKQLVKCKFEYCTLLLHCCFVKLEMGDKSQAIELLKEACGVSIEYYGRGSPYSKGLVECLELLRSGAINTVHPAKFGIELPARTKRPFKHP